MTVRQMFLCHDCGAEQGPFATQVYDPSAGTGSAITACAACGIVCVTHVQDHRIASPCPHCGRPLELYAARCPKCGSERCELELLIEGLPRIPR